jgi:hypothetical protein
MATTAVVIPVAEPEGEVEPTWESVLSEIRQELQSGFARLEVSIRENMENPRLVETLTQANTSLTGQITAMNESLVSRLDSLTQQPLEQPPVVIVPVETPPSVEAESPVVETSQVASEAPATQRKRRTM